MSQQINGVRVAPDRFLCSRVSLHPIQLKGAPFHRREQIAGEKVMGFVILHEEYAQGISVHLNLRVCTAAAASLRGVSGPSRGASGLEVFESQVSSVLRPEPRRPGMPSEESLGMG